MSRISIEGNHGGQQKTIWSRKNEEFIADFTLVSRRVLNEFEHRIFKFHFLLGADWRLCCRKLGMDRGNFFHEVYRIEQRLGRVFRELQPYGLYPLDEYFGGATREAETRARVSGRFWGSIGVPTVITMNPERFTAAEVSVVSSRLPDLRASLRSSSISWEDPCLVAALFIRLVSLTEPEDTSTRRMQLGQKFSRPTERMWTPQVGQVEPRTLDEGNRFLLCSTMGDRPARSSSRNSSFLSHPMTFVP